MANGQCLMPAGLQAGVASEDEVYDCINKEFNPVRVGFRGGPEVWTRDVLNLGAAPDKLIKLVGGGGRAGLRCGHGTCSTWGPHQTNSSNW